MPHGKHASPRINFHVSEALKKRIEAFAKRTGQTVTAVVTTAITEHLNKHEDQHDRGDQK